MKQIVKSKFSKIMMITFIFLLSGQIANGTVLLYTDRNEFESALSEFNIIDFNNIYQRPIQNTTIGDATFYAPGGLYSRGSNGSYSIAAENSGTIRITLNANYKAIGFDAGFLFNRTAALMQYTLTGTSGILSSNTSIWDEKLRVEKSGSFFGWISSDDYITRLEVYVYVPSVPAWPIMDNVTIGKPVPENQSPIADAGTNKFISSENQGTTIIQGAASDPDDDTMTFSWFEGTTALLTGQDVGTNGEAYLKLNTLPDFSIGQHILTLEVNDGTDTAADDMVLTIENSAPHAAASGGGVYEINTEVILEGSVADFDGDTLYYEWLEGTIVLDSGNVVCIKGGTPVAIPTYSNWNLGLGLHTFTLQVDDGFNEPVGSEITVEIVDTGVPTLAPVCNQLILWPPNHRMVDIYIETNASDGSGLPITLDAKVICDEPDNGLGDGDLAPDQTEPIINQKTGTIELQLRAERSGNGDGREYSIVITCTDLSGNSSTAIVNVIVPHNNKK